LTVAVLALADNVARADDSEAVPPPPKPEATPPPREPRAGMLLPKPAPEEAPPRRIRFVAEPISDSAILSLSIGVGALSGAILGTGEIVPQQPQSVDRLLPIDRGAVTATPNRTWDKVSDFGAYAAFGYAALDSVLSGVRHGPDAGVADAFIYAESIAVTWSVTNLAKIAFRRPRPVAYQEQQRLYDQYGEENAPAITDTNSALSFYSGHTAFAATVTATASYLAFARSPGSARAWATLGVGTAITALTAVGRVRSGEHFPTDVIAGAMAGAGIGVLVPHLHRADDAKQRPVWIGAAPAPGGGSMAFGAAF
jgi:membrane-associated phospholipid phosphatase